MLFCLHFILLLLLIFLKGTVVLTQSINATFKKQNHGFLQFLNSVPLRRHLQQGMVQM